MDALNSADGGDRIVLKAGNYGELNLSGSSRQNDYTFEDITIVSENRNSPGVFSSVQFDGVTNLTFDGVKLDSNGASKSFLFNGTRNITIVNSEIEGEGVSGHGLWVINSSDFRLENSRVENFNTGSHFRSIDDLQIIDNIYTGMGYDGMLIARIDGALIEGNRIEMNGKGVAHQDAIQFWNRDVNDPAEDIVIRGNTIIAADATHGIYMANDVAHQGGGLNSYYNNILIENNTIQTGHVLGLIVGQAVDVTVRNNTVLQHAAIDSNRPIDIPVIRVEDSSKNVLITGNTTHKTPTAATSANNWQPDDSVPSGWTISNNKLVPLGTTGGSSGGGSAPPPSPPSAPSLPSLPGGDGGADEFRYNGRNIDGKENVIFRNVDFTEGDRIILSNFDNGTFRHYAGDNAMAINADRNWVKLDSLVDLQELVTASPDVQALFQTTNDTLVMRIVQDDGTLDIALPGYAAAYKATFDTDLF